MSNFENEQSFLESMDHLQTKFNELNIEKINFNKRVKELYKQHILIYTAIVMLDAFLDNVDFGTADQSIVDFFMEQLKEYSRKLLFGSRFDDDFVTVDLI